MQNVQSQLMALLALAAAANADIVLPEKPQEPEVSTDEKIFALLEKVQDLALTHNTAVLSAGERNYVRNIVSDAPNAFGSDNKLATDTIVLQLQRCVEILETTPLKSVPEDIKPEDLIVGIEKLCGLVELLDKHELDTESRAVFFDIKKTLKHAPNCIGLVGINQQKLGEFIQEAWNNGIKIATVTSSITAEELEAVLNPTKKVTGVTDGEPTKNENKAMKKLLNNGMAGANLMRAVLNGEPLPMDLVRDLGLEKILGQKESYIPQTQDDSEGEPIQTKECTCLKCVLEHVFTELHKEQQPSAPALDAVTQLRGPWATSTSDAPALDAVPQVRESASEKLRASAERELIKETLNRNVGYVETELSSEEWYKLCKPKMRLGGFFTNNVRDANRSLGAMMATFNPEHFTVAHRKTFRKLLGFAVSMHDAGVPVTISIEKFEDVDYRGIKLKGMYLVVKTGSGNDTQTYYHGISFMQ